MQNEIDKVLEMLRDPATTLALRIHIFEKPAWTFVANREHAPDGGFVQFGFMERFDWVTR
jgi:hypothetical protein